MNSEEQDFSNYSYKVFNDSYLFRYKIAFSLLTMTPIHIKNIHIDSVNFGLQSYEINYLKLITMITNGSKVQINKTGSEIKFVPGTITNNLGTHFSFECDKNRGLSYYLEGILLISLYGKEKLNCCLVGVTNNTQDVSADNFKLIFFCIINNIVIGDNSAKFEIVSRALESTKKGGEVNVTIPIVKFIDSINFNQKGKLQNISVEYFGINATSSSNFLIERVKEHLKNLKVKIYYNKNVTNVKNEIPGCSLSLCAKFNTKFVKTYDNVVVEKTDMEEFAESVSKKFLIEILSVSLTYVYKYLRMM